VVSTVMGAVVSMCRYHGSIFALAHTCTFIETIARVDLPEVDSTCDSQCTQWVIG